jgi:hypothetical protein
MHNKAIEEVLKELNTSPFGLSQEEAERRLKLYGLNEIEERKEGAMGDPAEAIHQSSDFDLGGGRLFGFFPWRSARFCNSLGNNSRKRSYRLLSGAKGAGLNREPKDANKAESGCY